MLRHRLVGLDDGQTPRLVFSGDDSFSVRKAGLVLHSEE